MTPLWNKFKFGVLGSLAGGSGYVALDIGSTSIKMVETAIDKNGYHVLNLGILPLPSNAIKNNMIVEPGPIVDAIKRLIKDSGVKSKQVISAVPGRAVIMKKFQMPKQESAELENNIEFEAQNVIPENIDNVNLDYQVLSQSGDGNRMEILLVAVKKEIVNSYTDTISEAGLTPTLMDVDYFALENMFEANYEADGIKGVTGLIHIGAENTSISLLQDGVSTFTGDLSTGGGYFSDRLSQHLNLSREQAESFKITGVSEKAEGVDLESALRPISEELAEEIRRTVSLYGAVPSDDNDGLKAIYLSGGGARLTGLRAMLEDRMSVPVKLSEPFKVFNVGRKIDRNYLAENAPVYAVATGLSIRRPGDK